MHAALGSITASPTERRHGQTIGEFLQDQNQTDLFCHLLVQINGVKVMTDSKYSWKIGDLFEEFEIAFRYVRTFHRADFKW